eukprot:505937_1
MRGMDICHITWSVLLWYSGYGYAGKIQAVGMKRRDEILEVMVIVVNLELVIFMVIHNGVMGMVVWRVSNYGSYSTYGNEGRKYGRYGNYGGYACECPYWIVMMDTKKKNQLLIHYKYKEILNIVIFLSIVYMCFRFLFLYICLHWCSALFNYFNAFMI